MKENQTSQILTIVQQLTQNVFVFDSIKIRVGALTKRKRGEENNQKGAGEVCGCDGCCSYYYSNQMVFQKSSDLSS